MTAALLGTTLGVVSPSLASNATPQAEAYVVSAQALGGYAECGGAAKTGSSQQD